MNKKKAIFLMGPTACGKTNLALALAKIMPVEIINVDSAQVYIGMDIGTNKPTKIELNTVKHHLIDLCSPKEYYSVGRFCSDAKRILKEIYSRGNIPLLVGGTMLYFYSLYFGLSDLPSCDVVIRDTINQQAAEHGWLYLYAKLAQLDPIAAQKISINDKQRIQRALEINYLTKQNISENLTSRNNNGNSFINDWEIKFFGIIYKDRNILHQRIEDRFYGMLQQGLVNEVSYLLKQNISLELPSMRCVGYRQLIQYLQNNIGEQEAYHKAIIATRQLAKRQYTWLRKWQNKVELNLLYAELPEQSNLRLITRNIKC